MSRFNKISRTGSLPEYLLNVIDGTTQTPNRKVRTASQNEMAQDAEDKVMLTSDRVRLASVRGSMIKHGKGVMEHESTGTVWTLDGDHLVRLADDDTTLVKQYMERQGKRRHAALFGEDAPNKPEPEYNWRCTNCDNRFDSDDGQPICPECGSTDIEPCPVDEPEPYDQDRADYINSGADRDDTPYDPDDDAPITAMMKTAGLRVADDYGDPSVETEVPNQPIKNNIDDFRHEWSRARDIAEDLKAQGYDYNGTYNQLLQSGLDPDAAQDAASDTYGMQGVMRTHGIDSGGELVEIPTQPNARVAAVPGQKIVIDGKTGTVTNSNPNDASGKATYNVQYDDDDASDIVDDEEITQGKKKVKPASPTALSAPQPPVPLSTPMNKVAQEEDIISNQMACAECGNIFPASEDDGMGCPRCGSYQIGPYDGGNGDGDIYNNINPDGREANAQLEFLAPLLQMMLGGRDGICPDCIKVVKIKQDHTCPMCGSKLSKNDLLDDDGESGLSNIGDFGDTIKDIKDDSEGDDKDADRSKENDEEVPGKSGGSDGPDGDDDGRDDDGAGDDDRHDKRKESDKSDKSSGKRDSDDKGKDEKGVPKNLRVDKSDSKDDEEDDDKDSADSKDKDKDDKEKDEEDAEGLSDLFSKPDKDDDDKKKKDAIDLFCEFNDR